MPNVTGPVATTATNYPFLATDIDLAKYGYVEEEFFISGDAFRYDTSGPVTQNAEPIETGGADNDGKYDFKTRIVVRRPANPADANGQVVAEWNNVTATRDLEWNWFGDPYFLLENGYTFVGVTAQNTGVNSLKAFDAARYGDLTVIGTPPNAVPTGTGLDQDALSYDVFAAAINAVRGGGTGPDPMGGINVDKVIASGESQSCGRLANHYNRFEPLHEMLDAYLLTVCGSPLRTDRSDDKVVRILSETENRTERTTANFPDTSAIRHWEVAAGSHLSRIAFDNINAVLTRDFLSLTVTCEKFPLSLVQWPYTQNKAIKDLVAWSGGGAAPPIAPRGEYVANPAYDPAAGPSQANPERILKRDRFGIALGGIRYPEVTVPTAVNDGTNVAVTGGSPFSAFCGLLGSSTPFPKTQLESLYTDYLDYVQKYSAAAEAMTDTGFILPEDVVRLKAYARKFPELRPAEPLLIGEAANRGEFGLSWVGTEADDTNFELQRFEAAGGADAGTVSMTIQGNQELLKGEKQGTYRYKVRNRTVIPATNISKVRTTVTSYSDPSPAVKIDRSGPKAPKVVLKGKRVKGKKNTFRGKVRVRFVGRPDVKLPDGSAGVGLNRKSVPKPKKIGKKGKKVIKVRTRDKLGNKSKVTRVVIRIKR
ncbi:MAG: alpha/beta hydrolase domain-containing protein [Solirubrobacterales bacterium]